MVMSGQSVHLTTPFPWASLTKRLISTLCTYFCLKLTNKVSKGAKIRNQYNQVLHLTQDTNGKVTNSQLDTTNESQEVSPFPAGDHRRAQRHSKHKTEQKIHKRSTALERSVKYFTGGLKLVSRRINLTLNLDVDPS